MRFYSILAEAPIRGNQVKELYICAETEEELQKKLPIAFEKELKCSEKLDSRITIISKQSWDLGITAKKKKDKSNKI